VKPSKNPKHQTPNPKEISIADGGGTNRAKIEGLIFQAFLAFGHWRLWFARRALNALQA
jgi:hypothetical protein